MSLSDWWRNRVYQIKLVRWEAHRDKAIRNRNPFNEPKPELKVNKESASDQS
jgi:hypothetical protein